MCRDIGDDPFKAYQTELVAAGLLIPLGVPGLYGRSGRFERIIAQFEAHVARTVAPFQPEVIRFPPLFPRSNYEKIDHIKNFPDLLGSVHTFTGKDAEHQELLRIFSENGDWSRNLSPTASMLVPAACYPLYPTARGTLPEGGRLVDLSSYVFRHEPSEDPARMQMFRMRELVRLGTPEEALGHRNEWLERGKRIFESLGLPVEAVVANDPFFGRGGKVMKVAQREQVLKYELVIPICSTEKPTAIFSSNYHLDHFGSLFGINTADGQVAHSACIGFGLERITLALLKTHGFDVARWPANVRDILELN